jgi:hypothetical protein
VGYGAGHGGGDGGFGGDVPSHGENVGVGIT